MYIYIYFINVVQDSSQKLEDQKANLEVALRIYVHNSAIYIYIYIYISMLLYKARCKQLESQLEDWSFKHAH